MARGIDEPSVGALLDFREEPRRGVAGIGLGVQTFADRENRQLTILVREGRTLEVNGTELAMADATWKIPQDVQQAMALDQQRIGLTATLRRNELRLTLRAQNPVDHRIAEIVQRLPIDPQARQRLLGGHLSVLARDGWQRVTPFFDDGQRPAPDPRVAAPIGRWREAESKSR